MADAPIQPPQQIFNLQSRVPIMPVPTHVDLDLIPGPAGNQVGLRIQTPVGVFAFPLTADQAKELGEQLRNAGTRAALGLVIPSAKLQ